MRAKAAEQRAAQAARLGQATDRNSHRAAELSQQAQATRVENQLNATRTLPPWLQNPTLQRVTEALIGQGYDQSRVYNAARDLVGANRFDNGTRQFWSTEAQAKASGLQYMKLRGGFAEYYDLPDSKIVDQPTAALQGQSAAGREVLMLAHAARQAPPDLLPGARPDEQGFAGIAPGLAAAGGVPNSAASPYVTRSGNGRGVTNGGNTVERVIIGVDPRSLNRTHNLSGKKSTTDVEEIAK